MTEELTPKQESFAQKYIETKGNASEAYRQSYDCANSKEETIWSEASRTLAIPHVDARIKKLREHHLKRHEVTVDSLTKEYEDIRNAAYQEKQFAPAVSAVTGKAKLHGLVTDKAQIGGDQEKPIKMNITITPEEAYKRLLHGK